MGHITVGSMSTEVATILIMVNKEILMLTMEFIEIKTERNVCGGEFYW